MARSGLSASVLSERYVPFWYSYGWFVIQNSSEMVDVMPLVGRMHDAGVASDGTRLVVRSPHQVNSAARLTLQTWSAAPPWDDGWQECCQATVEGAGLLVVADAEGFRTPLVEVQGLAGVRVQGRAFTARGWPGGN